MSENKEEWPAAKAAAAAAVASLLEKLGFKAFLFLSLFFLHFYSIFFFFFLHMHWGRTEPVWTSPQWHAASKSTQKVERECWTSLPKSLSLSLSLPSFSLSPSFCSNIIKDLLGTTGHFFNFSLMGFKWQHGRGELLRSEKKKRLTFRSLYRRICFVMRCHHSLKNWVLLLKNL